MKKEKLKRHKIRIYGFVLAMIVSLLCMEETVYAITNKSGCEKKGTVTAEYDTSGSAANGYYKKNGKVVVTYTMGEPSESCSNTTYQYVGITNKVQVPEIDASETNVSSEGHMCNGHTSNTAHWRHWFGASGTILYGMGTKNIGSVTVTEEEYSKCKYVIAGPSSSFGDGIESDGKFKWVVLYKKLPSSIDDSKIDATSPSIELSAVPSGKVATNPVNGKAYGTEGTLTAVSKDNESRPHKTKTFLWKGNGSNLTGWISANSGNKKSISASYKVNTNGSYSVETQNQLGNSAESKNVSVDFIDLTEPWSALSKTVNGKVTVNGKEWTSTTVIVKATASDSGVGLASKPYCFDKVTWTASPDYVISQNGTYQVKVQDALGNVAQKSITIDNFDRQTPEGDIATEYENSLILEEKEWSNEGVTVKIEAKDEGCGLDETPYSFDGGKSWVGESKHTFLENGSYQIKIRDSLHNTKNEEIEITGIDKKAPVIKSIRMEPEIWKEGNGVVVIDAADNEGGCGLAATPYSFDGGNTWTKDNKIILTKTTEMEICVRDQLGNIVKETFLAKCTPDEVKKDNEGEKDDKDNNTDTDGESDKDNKNNEKDNDETDKKENEIKDQTGEENDTKQIEKSDEKGKEVITEEGKTTNVTETDTSKKKTKTQKTTDNNTEETVSQNTGEETNSEDDIVKKAYQVTFPVLEEEQEPIQIEEYSMEEPSGQNQEKTFWEKLGMLALIAILLLGLLGLLVWYLFVFGKYRAVLYGKEEGSYKRLGTVTITQKEEQDYIEIPDELLQKIEGNCYRIKISVTYLLEREGMEIYLAIEERMLKKQVAKQIDFYTC